MGRPPSNGGPSFRFNPAEIAEMEAILQAHKTAMPERQVLVSLADKFSNSEERLGKIEVQMKQVWNWFQNRRYAIRAKAAKSPGKLNMSQAARDEVKGVPQATQPHTASSATVRSLPQAPQHPTVPSASVRTFPQAPQHPPAFSVQTAGRVADNSQMEYEAKSARDGAWYDVSTFLSHRSLDSVDPEVLVRFAGFGAEEDEWVNVRKNVRQRSLPCESSECVAVLPSDLILCFQEGKEQALYFDAHVLDAQRRRHDVRGCRCRFLVRYDHDQSEEIVALRKICRRPETDYRLQQLHAVNESISANQNKHGASNNIHTVSTLRVYPPAEVQPKQLKLESPVPPSPAEAPHKRQRLESTVPSEGSQMQSKAETIALADVPQNQQAVQPVVTGPGVKVEHVVPASLAQPIVEPHKVEPVVPSQSNQGSLEPKMMEPVQNFDPVGPTHSVDVPLDRQNVQSMMLDPSTEVSIEPRKVESDVPSASEAKQELQTMETDVVVPLPEASEELPAVGSAVPPPAEASIGPNEGEPEVAGPQKESVVSCSSVDVPAELHEVQPDAPDLPHASALETKAEEPVVPVSTNGSNLVEAIETKTEGPMLPVSTDGPNVVVSIETKAEELVMPVSTDGPNVVEATETKTEEPVVPVPADCHMVKAIETKTEEPIVSVSTDGPYMVEAAETKTKEPVVPVSTNDMKVDEEVIESKTEEPVVHVSTNDSNVVQEAKIEGPVVPANDPNVSEAEIEQPNVSEVMESNKDSQANVTEKASDSKAAQENAAVAMEEG